MGDRDKRNLHKVYVGNLSPNITEQEISDEVSTARTRLPMHMFSFYS